MQQIFRSTFTEGLKANLRHNLGRYTSDALWISDIARPADFGLSTSLVPEGPLDLIEPKEKSEFATSDHINAVRLFKAFPNLTRFQARDPRLWTRLTHYELWTYMRKRWPVDNRISTTEPNKAPNFILWRYFIAQNHSRALMRNGAARLWWSAFVSVDQKRENPFELTAVLFSTLDITQSLVERNLGHAPHVVHGFLSFLHEQRETLLTGGNLNRVRIRELAKHLNLVGGVCVLDQLNVQGIKDLLSKRLETLPETVSENEATPESDTEDQD